MNLGALELFDAALQLPEEDRAELAARLIDSLEPEGEEDVQSAWSAEVARRLEELDSGTVKPIPWSEARRLILSTSSTSC